MLVQFGFTLAGCKHLKGMSSDATDLSLWESFVIIITDISYYL